MVFCYFNANYHTAMLKGIFYSRFYNGFLLSQHPKGYLSVESFKPNVRAVFGSMPIIISSMESGGPR
ncbi:hypothetical protein AQUCO_02100057v1 [Aquilegia coerulea]|uniref:Uncharacterized protein n=1 Tax=Aquilegia coerulea TaxID=218851 RepID=A0A2G5DEJ5_AQUCA|nr:hypothetical protein AQUCO_02100057v1 [Aquilegia coerulea]